MTTRDRLVLVGLSALAVLAVFWLLLVAPKRDEAAKLATQVSAASAQLASAEGQATTARAAQTRYSAAYASVVSLGKAVPPSEEVPSLMYQLAHASNQKNVEFNSIVWGSGATAGASAAASAAPVAAATGFTQMPFTFVFDGSFSDLSHLFKQLNLSTVRTSSGGLQVSGRLLTLQAVKLAPVTTEATGGSARLTGTITATAYVLPASQGLTAGASSASPAASGATSASSAAGSPAAGSSSTPAPVATVGVTR
jgi:Tfp pilus assembly protein PilO